MFVVMAFACSVDTGCAGLITNKVLCAAVQPNNIPDGGVRYGIQIGQAFGYDFGIGIIRDICFISFTTV